MNTKIQYVTGMHGHEIIPVLALASLDVPQLVVSPRAVRERVRYVDTDPNSAFGKNGTDYAAECAQRVLEQIPEDTHVIDFHTFTAPSPAFSILVDPSMLPFALRAGIKNIVYMKHNIKKGGALINHRNGISIEVSQHDDKNGFDVIADIINNMHSGVSLKSEEVTLFEVYDVIAEKGEYINFELHPDGYYPILAGENSYTIGGLKARKVEKFEE